jgi:glutamyl-tRNA reductase
MLIVGAGSVATRAALNARTRGCREIVVANRTLAHARWLAGRVGGRAVTVGGLAGDLASADVVVSATAGRGFVLTAEHAAARAERTGRALAVFDLALPRDVDPAFRDLQGAHLFDLDDLARVVAASGAGRRAAMNQAAAIADEEAASYEKWRHARAAAPAIAVLRDDAEQARRALLTRYSADLARFAPDQRALVDKITSQLAAKLLHAPTLDLRRAANVGP